MTEQQDEDEPDIPTAADAKREWTEHIAWLRAGDKGQRRLADLLAQCRKGKRCNLLECPKCERRRKIARMKIPAETFKTIGSFRPLHYIRVRAIHVDGKRRPLDQNKVRAIAASMDLVGLQTPISVQERGKKVRLVTGAHRLAAAKTLGWKTIPSMVLLRDTIQTRIWQIVENLYRAELTALERAELTEELRQLVRQQVGQVATPPTEKLRQLVRQQEGQVAPPGGHQPQDKGINKAAKVLGLTKEEIRRSRAIAGISPKAKDKVRKLGLDDNQLALLKIAKQPTPETQLRVIEEIVERKRAVRNGDASVVAADRKTTAEINALDADIHQKERALKRLKGDVAASRQRRQELDDKLAVHGEVADLGPPAEDASHGALANCGDRAPDVAAAGVGEEVASPATIPTGDGDTFLDRHPLSPEDQRALDLLQAAWDTHMQPLLNGVSAVVRERFKAAVFQADASSRPVVG
jgi:ParB-like chromosome segregation protein Spo0J